MSNRIFGVDLLTTRFDPSEAEVTIVVTPEQPAENLELRGRLMGPRCPYAETVEIAYNLRPLPPQDDLPRARIIIPEASPWEPTTPFLYEGPLELWQGSTKLDERRISYGLKNLVLRRKGLVLNGKPFQFRGMKLDHCEEAEAGRLHDANYNLLCAPVTGGDDDLWKLADRFGLFMLGQVDAGTDELFWFAEEELNPHVSSFGWVLPQSVLEQRQLWHTAVSVLRGHRQQLLMGIKLDEPFTGVLPGEVSFVVCSEQLLPELEATKLAKILIVKGNVDDRSGEISPHSVILGRICKHGPEDVE
jgi:hypothetical protein